jgi:hypothetical protein
MLTQARACGFRGRVLTTRSGCEFLPCKVRQRHATLPNLAGEDGLEATTPVIASDDAGL